MNPFRGALAFAGLSPIGLAIIVFGGEAYPALPLVCGSSTAIAASAYVEFGVVAVAKVRIVYARQISGAVVAASTAETVVIVAIRATQAVMVIVAADAAGAADIVVATIAAAEGVVAHVDDAVVGGVGHTGGPRGLGIIVGIVVLAGYG